jgi:hypothetical protein
VSSGAGCSFREVAPGQWTYWLQHYPYGETEDGTTYGPFRSHVLEFGPGEVEVKVGVTVKVRIESLGPEPSKEAVLALLSSGRLTVDNLVVYDVYGRRPGIVCDPCGKEQSK